MGPSSDIWWGVPTYIHLLFSSSLWPRWMVFIKPRTFFKAQISLQSFIVSGSISCPDRPSFSANHIESQIFWPLPLSSKVKAKWWRLETLYLKSLSIFSVVFSRNFAWTHPKPSISNLEASDWLMANYARYINEKVLWLFKCSVSRAGFLCRQLLFLYVLSKQAHV